MGKRKIVILDKAVEEVANVAYIIEGKGLPATAKKFVDEAFLFFETLADDSFVHKPCKQSLWQILNYRCANYKKKFMVAYLSNQHEIIICDFAIQKLLKH
jgi:hypothetical protein